MHPLQFAVYRHILVKGKQSKIVDMYEDYEGCSDTQGLEGFADSKSLNERNYISGTEQSYIEEVMPYKDSELLAARAFLLRSGMVFPR